MYLENISKYVLWFVEDADPDYDGIAGEIEAEAEPAVNYGTVKYYFLIILKV